MQLPMDVRLASQDARFGFVFARRGIVPEAASSWFLPQIVGISRALEWCMTGRIFDAAEALEGGLVRSVHAPDDLLPAAYALAAEIADNTSPVSVALTRQMLWRMAGADHPMEAHKVDSRGDRLARRVARRRRGRHVVPGEAPSRTSRSRVSTDMPDFFPWWEERPFREGWLIPRRRGCVVAEIVDGGHAAWREARRWHVRDQRSVIRRREVRPRGAVSWDQPSSLRPCAASSPASQRSPTPRRSASWRPTTASRSRAAASPTATGSGRSPRRGRAEVVRRAKAAYLDRRFAQEAHELRSRIFVAHIRFATNGEDLERNTHPFVQHDRIFAHNGVVHGLDELEARLRPEYRDARSRARPTPSASSRWSRRRSTTTAATSPRASSRRRLVDRAPSCRCTR